jgi:DNA-binding transcriptional LysR family regulator
MSMIAAVQEMGVDLGFSPFVDRAISRGLLVEPFDIRVTTKMAYWLVCPTANAESEMVQKFRDWLRGELGLAEQDAPLAEDVPAVEFALTEPTSIRAAE